MAVILPDPFDEWADILDTAVMGAITRWLATIESDLYPTLIAAADDETMPNIEALLAAITAWELVVTDDVLPLLVGVLARRMVDMADARGMNLTDLTDDTTARGPVADIMAKAVSALEAAGITTAGIDRVIHIPSWVDFIDDYATTSVNLVRGMPETVYRDLVTKLATATREGMDSWERTRMVRSFLSMEAEGGYDQWMQRTHRISRTEVNRAINAADLQATRTESAATGKEMDKAWVATTDSRTRDEHFSADGQRVPLDGKFLIGGYEADHPGDPALPAHLSIQCRCTVIYLRPDEPLPGEDDRQTERERRSKAEEGETRDPQAEVRRRADAGVTRARDDATVTAAAQNGDTPMRTTFSGVLAPIGSPTGDGRIIDPDAAITFREFPLPLLFQRATSGGHDTSIVVGKITDATLEDTGIHAVGEFFDTTDAAEAKELVAEEVSRPSIDMADMVIEWELLNADDQPVDPEVDDWEEGWHEVMHVRSASIVAATLVAKPAFAEAKIVLGEATEAPNNSEEEVEALTAAAALTESPTAPSSAFTDPGLGGPTALTVTDDGHVYGHLALWGTEHVGMPGRNITPPKTATDYAMFHVSTVDTDQGPVSCGRLTVGTGHAEAHAGMSATAAHYDQTGTCWALVRAGEDAHGIWVAGVVNPDADEASVRAGAAAPLSGDWRSVGGNLELVAALSVNTPGFPVPRSYSVRAGAELSLVAAAVMPRRTKGDEMADAVAEGLRRHDAYRAQQEDAAQQRSNTARSLAASILARQIGGAR